MSPDYRSGDYVIVLKPRLAALRIGHDIVFRDRSNGLLIKRVSAIHDDGIVVEGTNTLSAAGIHIGDVDRRSVIGRVIAHIKKPGQNDVRERA